MKTIEELKEGMGVLTLAAHEAGVSMVVIMDTGQDSIISLSVTSDNPAAQFCNFVNHLTTQFNKHIFGKKEVG